LSGFDARFPIWVKLGAVGARRSYAAEFYFPTEKPMKQVRRAALAASTLACAALFSFGWSEQGGVSLSVEAAQARVGRPLTPMSVAGVHRRQMRRAGYGYGYGAAAVGAGLAAGAVGTAAVAAATSPWGWGGREDYGAGDPCATGVGCAGPNVGAGYYTGPLAANAAYTGAFHTDDAPFYIPRAYHAAGPWLGYAGWADYKARNGISCDPGTLTKLSDGLQYVCQ
jgi:hypothetical protein